MRTGCGDVGAVQAQDLWGLHTLLQGDGDRRARQAHQFLVPALPTGARLSDLFSSAAECQTFSCLWLVDDQFDQHWKPSKSKLVLTTSEDGIEVRCDPGFPNAWRKEPFWSEIREWAISGETHDVTVVGIVGQRMTLITPDREFDLGIVGPDERIVRELQGNQIVNFTVAKAGDLESGT